MRRIGLFWIQLIYCPFIKKKMLQNILINRIRTIKIKIRILVFLLAQMLSASMYVIMYFVGSNVGAMITLMTLTLGFCGITMGGGYNVNHLDIGPKIAGLFDCTTIAHILRCFVYCDDFRYLLSLASKLTVKGSILKRGCLGDGDFYPPSRFQFHVFCVCC